MRSIFLTATAFILLQGSQIMAGQDSKEVSYRGRGDFDERGGEEFNRDEELRRRNENWNRNPNININPQNPYNQQPVYIQQDGTSQIFQQNLQNP